MAYLLIIPKLIIKFIYLIFRIFPINEKKVVFISRQSNSITLDFKLLKEEITKLDDSFKIVVLCNKLQMSFKGIISYSFVIIKQLYHLATSKVCVVDSYCMALSNVKLKKGITVIQIWHAIATIKKFGYQTIYKQYGRQSKVAKILNMHKNYDYVVSGSETMKPIFAEAFNVPTSKVICCGTPRIDYLLRNCDNIKDEILKHYPQLTKKKNILYAPTFRRDKDIGINKLVNIIDFNKYNLIVKTHPVKNQTFNNKFILNCKEFITTDLLTVADYVITDYSSICIESALLNKPTYFYLYDIDDYNKFNGLNVDLEKEMKPYCFKNFNKLYKSLEKNYQYEKLHNLKNKYVTNQNGNSTTTLAELIVHNRQN